MELTAAKRNSLPVAGTAGLLPEAAAAELICSSSSTFMMWGGGWSWAAFLGLSGKDMV